jgi:hypothetical protein
LYVNGVLRDTKNNTQFQPYLPQFWGLAFVAMEARVLKLNDRIRAAALYTTRLTNAELATLTTL